MVDGLGMRLESFFADCGDGTLLSCMVLIDYEDNTSHCNLRRDTQGSYQGVCH